MWENNFYVFYFCYMYIAVIIFREENNGWHESRGPVLVMILTVRFSKMNNLVAELEFVHQ